MQQIEQVQETAPAYKKSLQVHASTDGISISTTSSDNDLLMVGLLGMIVLTAFAMWIKYKAKNKQ